MSQQAISSKPTALSFGSPAPVAVEHLAISSGDLSEADRKRWLSLKKKVFDGLDHWIEACWTLNEIKERELWRAEYDSWDDFRESVLEMSRSYAYRLLSAGKVLSSLSPIGDKLPDRESQIRELGRISDPDLRQKAWARSVATAKGAPVTARNVRKAVNGILKEIGPPPEANEKHGNTFSQRTGILFRAIFSEFASVS